VWAAIGVFNIDHPEYKAAELRVEYQPAFSLGVVRPLAALGVTSDGSSFVGAGVGRVFELGERLVARASLLANHYAQRSSGHGLGHAIEFRSQALLAWRFDDDAKLGIAISHYSNGGLGERNPGSETLSLYYSLPTRSAPRPCFGLPPTCTGGIVRGPPSVRGRAPLR